ITNNYSRLANRKIKKALAGGIEVQRERAAGEIINLYINHYANKHVAIDQKSYNGLKNIAARLGPGAVQTYYAHFADGEPAAFYMVFTDSNNAYSIIGGSTEKGKEYGAFFLLTDEAVKANAGHKKTFRFEGSDLEGIAFFNRQFNPVKIQYAHVKFNGLPFPLKLLKR
ncbi:MAG TPA: GNAT family N-acetyltransferase, partial [Chitinophagaceae bacterium]|nr:GNAT family N-acetyltransferase [Chitinophagaceae bacterium]